MTTTFNTWNFELKRHPVNCISYLYSLISNKKDFDVTKIKYIKK